MATSERLGVFQQALKELADARVKLFSGFSEYKKRVGFAGKDTAGAISVQTLAGLDRELRNGHVMVFRCGSGDDRFTRFALARAVHWPDDYFLLDAGFDSVWQGLREVFNVGLVLGSKRQEFIDHCSDVIEKVITRGITHNCHSGAPS